METDEDEVAAEYDVFLSKELADKLFLMQYVVRPTERTYDDVECLSARAKPQQQKVEMDFVLNTTGSSYCSSKGHLLASKADPPNSTEPGLYPSGKLDRQTLTSVTSGVDASRYVIGTWKGNQFHMTPLKGIIQMRPGFNYLDQADVHASQTAQEEEAEAENEEEEEEELESVSAKPTKQESAEAKARRLASYEHLVKKRDEEKWVTLQPHDIYNRFSVAERELLYYSPELQNLGEMAQDPAEGLEPSTFLEQLIPKMETEEVKRPALPTNILSMSELKKMSTDDQVKSLLMNAKVISFGQLMSLLPKGTDGGIVLRTLEKVAVLVQGCWVVKSELLYPEGSQSPLTGAPAIALCRGRNYLLWRLTQTRHVLRKDITPIVKLPAEDVKAMLEQVAIMKVNIGWEFILPPDTDFLARHPDVAQQQSKNWDRKFRELQSALKLSPTDVKHAAEAAAAAHSPVKRRRTISRSVSCSDNSDSDVTDATGRVRHGSGRSRLLSEKSRRDSTADRVFSQGRDSPRANGVEPPGTPLVKSVSGPASLADDLTAFIHKSFTKHSLLKVSDVNKLIAIELAQNTLGKKNVLGAGGITERLIEDCIKACGGLKVQPASCKMEESVFVNVKVGDGKDPIRQAVVDIVVEKASFQTRMLKKRLAEIQPDEPEFSDNVVKKVVKELCDGKAGWFYIKGSVTKE